MKRKAPSKTEQNKKPKNSSLNDEVIEYTKNIGIMEFKVTNLDLKNVKGRFSLLSETNIKKAISAINAHIINNLHFQKHNTFVLEEGKDLPKTIGSPCYVLKELSIINTANFHYDDSVKPEIAQISWSLEELGRVVDSGVLPNPPYIYRDIFSMLIKYVNSEAKKLEIAPNTNLNSSEVEDLTKNISKISGVSDGGFVGLCSLMVFFCKFERLLGYSDQKNTIARTVLGKLFNKNKAQYGFGKQKQDEADQRLKINENIESFINEYRKTLGKPLIYMHSVFEPLVAKLICEYCGVVNM